MCIYLLDIYYPKIHLSYILLFIQNKNTRLDFLLQIKVQSSSIILHQSHPIYSSFIRIIWNFRSEILVLTKIFAPSSSPSFLVAPAPMPARRRRRCRGRGSHAIFLSDHSVTQLYYQPATRLQTYTKAASSSSDLYRTACETTAAPTATPATHSLQTEK